MLAQMSNLLFEFLNTGYQALDSFEFHFHACSNQQGKRNQHKYNRVNFSENIAVIKNRIEKRENPQNEQNCAPSQHQAPFEINIQLLHRQKLLWLNDLNTI